MKKIISIIILLILAFSNTFAEIKVISKEYMQELAKKGEDIKNRKLYHTFEWTYLPKSKDKKLLAKVDVLFKKINKTNPEKLRKIYKKIDSKLSQLGKKVRDSTWKGVTKKNTRIYFLLEQINNKITDLEGNQDLGCAKNIAKAHMEHNKCVSNIRFIKDETWVGSQSYDYIFKKQWGNVIMTHCNDWYTKKESTYNGYPITLCVDKETSLIDDLINSGDLVEDVEEGNNGEGDGDVDSLEDLFWSQEWDDEQEWGNDQEVCSVSNWYLQNTLSSQTFNVTSTNFDTNIAKWKFTSANDCKSVDNFLLNIDWIEDFSQINWIENVSCELIVKTWDTNSWNLLIDKIELDMTGGNQEFDIDELEISSGTNFIYFWLECDIDKAPNYNWTIIWNFDFDFKFDNVNMEMTDTWDENNVDLSTYEIDNNININVNIQ